ncbi:MAG: hypothetical protein SFW36_10195 [Leptolyngbyaceae cyanobacterium bins.59]|nr:hypothetical protein [Leptolyngbyaceae cyanobacterium bins.59]
MTSCLEEPLLMYSATQLNGSADLLTRLINSVSFYASVKEEEEDLEDEDEDFDEEDEDFDEEDEDFDEEDEEE